MKMGSFTLIELLLVVAIIGILSSILLPSISRARHTAKRAVCTNNLKQSGVAIYTYASDGDGIINTNRLVNTVSSKRYYPLNNDPSKKYRDGSTGYLETYLGEADEAYFCPGSEHPSDFGGNDSLVTRAGVYLGFPTVLRSARKIDNNFLYSESVDTTEGWSAFNRVPVLTDPVIDMSAWGESSDPSSSVIHQNTGYLPILMSDGGAIQFNRKNYPVIWPLAVNDYAYIMDDILSKGN
ncbi:MAG: type II secretion system GspH family protein [Lentisphaeraceae bacterium]|nr:type II secretion system GspH family protein [Lentisphaeraceae bacterium]